MELTEFIAAVDLGTSKIVGIVGTKSADGSLEIHAVEKEDADACMKRGYIQNVDAAAVKVKRIIEKLEHTAKCHIGKLYVGISGQSIQSIDHKVSEVFSSEMQISDEIIEALKEKSKNHPISGSKEILDIVPSEYLVDGQKSQQPVGTYGSEIKATHKIIVGRPIIKKNIDRMLDKIQMPLAGYILSPLAAAATLSEPEKNLGCILVDFGAATTTVSIYKENMLRHLSVIPLGGDTITKDITSLQLVDREAEKVKIAFGNAAPEIEENEVGVIKQVANSQIDTPEIQLQTLHQVVLCRSEEILENVINQIKLAEFESKNLGVGFVLTGGAANLKGLTALLRKKSEMEVKLGVFQKRIKYVANPDIRNEMSYAVLLGLLQLGVINCSKPKEVDTTEESVVNEPEPVVENTSSAVDSNSNKTTGKKILSWFDRFTTENDNSFD